MTKTGAWCQCRAAQWRLGAGPGIDMEKFMTTASVDFYGGPFDGQTEHWPADGGFELTLSVIPNHDPSVLAIYQLRSVALGSPPLVRYVYEGTVAAPAA